MVHPQGIDTSAGFNVGLATKGEDVVVVEDVAAALSVPARGPWSVQTCPGVLLEVIEDGRGVQPGGHVGTLQEEKLVRPPVLRQDQSRHSACLAPQYGGLAYQILTELAVLHSWMRLEHRLKIMLGDQREANRCDQILETLLPCLWIHLNPSEDALEDALLAPHDDVVHLKVLLHLGQVQLEELLGLAHELKPLQKEVVSSSFNFPAGEGTGKGPRG